MGFFLRKTWPWWLLAAFLAWLITWFVCRWRNRRGDAQALVDARADALRVNQVAADHQARIDDLLAQRARDLDEIGRLRDAPAGGTAALGLVGAVGAAAVPAADAAPAEAPTPPVASEAVAATAPATATVPDAEALTAGGAVLGRKLTLDDLKVVEGVGPAIEELLHNGGIRTWRGLEAAEPTALKAILDAAGPRFRVHDPATWPRQAGLLAGAKWQEFKDLTDALTAGRE